MRDLFAIDGTIYHYMMRLYQLLILNLLFIICSLPIVTIGAALTALYDVTLKMHTHDEKTVATAYFKSFRKNFSQATQIWLMSLLVFTFAYLMMSMTKGNPFISLPLLLLIVMTVATLIYAFSLIAKFQNSTRIMLRNALLLAIQHAPYTIVMLVIAGVFCLYIPINLRWASLLSLLLTFSLTAFVQSHFIHRILVDLSSKVK